MVLCNVQHFNFFQFYTILRWKSNLCLVLPFAVVNSFYHFQPSSPIPQLTLYPPSIYAIPSNYSRFQINSCAYHNKSLNRRREWCHMTKYDVTWPSITSHDQAWRHMTKYNGTCPSMASHNQAWSHMIKHDVKRSSKTLDDHAWCQMIRHNFTWSSRTLND